MTMRVRPGNVVVHWNTLTKIQAHLRVVYDERQTHLVCCSEASLRYKLLLNFNLS